MDSASEADYNELASLFSVVAEDGDVQHAPSLKESCFNYLIRNYYKIKIDSFHEFLSEDLSHGLLLRALELGSLPDPLLQMFDHKNMVVPEIQRQVNLPIVQQGDSNVLPIHYAIQYNNVDLLHFLLRHEVDVNAECEIPQSKLKYTGHTIIQAQQTPLMTAMFLERSNMCKILVEAGANMHCIFYVFDGFWPFSCNPLRFAMAFQNVELVKYFLEKGCFIDQDTQNAVKLAEKQYSKRILEVVRSNLKKQQESNRVAPEYSCVGPALAEDDE